LQNLSRLNVLKSSINQLTKPKGKTDQNVEYLSIGVFGMFHWYKTALPISSDWLQDLHHPGIRENLDKTQQIVVYHGTSSKRLVNILAHGSLDPAISGSPEYKSYLSASPGIFVTTSPTGFIGAGMYAYHATSNEENGDGSDEVILELVVPWYWIDQDPDDTRITEQGETNDLGRIQGIVRRSISVKRIRNIVVYNKELREIIPYQPNEIFERTMTKWMPIGKFMDVVKKNVDSLPEEYRQMIGHSKGLSRSDNYTDIEEDVAVKLLELVQTFFYSMDYSFDDTFAWVLANKNLALYSYNKRDVIHKYLKDIGVWEELEDQGYKIDDIVEYLTDN